MKYALSLLLTRGRRLSALLVFALVLTVLGAPGALAVQLRVSWQDNSQGEQGFRIERSTDGETFSEIAVVAANRTSYIDTEVPEGMCWYRVRAYNEDRVSAYSNVGVYNAGNGTGTTEPGDTGPSSTGPTRAPSLPGPGFTEDSIAAGGDLDSSVDAHSAARDRGSRAAPESAIAASRSVGPTILNSTTARVGSGENALSTIFQIAGNKSRQVLILALGPSLAAAQGLTPLADPELYIFHGGELIGRNDNWEEGPSLRAALIQAGWSGLPDGSKDAALLVTLPPGTYTAVVSSTNPSSGLVMLEVVEMP